MPRSRHSTFAANADDLRLIEWLFASMWLSWGMWLLWPGWHTFENSQYAALAEIMVQWKWGFLTVCFALARMTILWINGRWRRSPALRCGFSIGGLMWFVALVWLYRKIDL
jgi:hypothetical protein